MAPRKLQSVRDLAELVRRARKDQALDQAEAAGLTGVGVRFFGDIERSKPTVRLGLVLQVLQRLGLEVWIAPRGWQPPP